jgi:hypothetical protein
MQVSTAGVPPVLLSSNRFTAAQVAPTYNLTPAYFVKCIKAKANEAYRLRQGISRRTLDVLPLLNWEKLGRSWVIRLPDLMAQVSRG